MKLLILTAIFVGSVISTSSSQRTSSYRRPPPYGRPLPEGRRHARNCGCKDECGSDEYCVNLPWKHCRTTQRYLDLCSVVDDGYGGYPFFPPCGPQLQCDRTSKLCRTPEQVRETRNQLLRDQRYTPSGQPYCGNVTCSAGWSCINVGEKHCKEWSKKLDLCDVVDDGTGSDSWHLFGPCKRPYRCDPYDTRCRRYPFPDHRYDCVELERCCACKNGECGCGCGGYPRDDCDCRRCDCHKKGKRRDSDENERYCACENGECGCRCGGYPQDNCDCRKCDCHKRGRRRDSDENGRRGDCDKKEKGDDSDGDDRRK